MRGTRLSVAFILSCLADGMSPEEIAPTCAPFPRESLPEIMRLASELLDHPHVAACANMPAQLVQLLAEFGIQSTTAQSQGWGGLSNCALVEAAATSGFGTKLATTPN